MSVHTYLQLNAPDVVSETIEGETVIINLFKGLYYNLNTTGSAIWMMIESGTPVEAIIQAFQDRYSDLDPTAQASIWQLVERLKTEELVTEVSAPSTPAAIAPLPALGQFAAPVLYKYADMQDLLALDPIHDVDETGWPNVPAEVVNAANF